MDRSIEIMEKYLELIYDLGYDYDGCNDVESLKGLIDEMCRLASLGRARNVTEPIYVDSKGKEANILGEIILKGEEMNKIMNIKSDLKKEDYQWLINEAKEDIINHTSSMPTKVINIETSGEMRCDGVKISDGGRTIEGKYIPPKMKFAFILEFSTNDIDLARKLMKQEKILIDDKKYYLGEYGMEINPLEINERIFEFEYISYNLSGENYE